jgi:PAS domain S-box-containing protein
VEQVPASIIHLLEGSVDAAVVLDEHCRVLYFNSAYQALAGLCGRELERRLAAGAGCSDLFRLELCGESCIGRRAMESNRPLRVDEVRAFRSDGEELRLIVAAIPIEQRFVVETYRDVTAEARVQRRLKGLLEKERSAKRLLEEEVATRTRELRQAQAQLVHQEKMSSLGRLLAGVAHELNNPINFVFGNVDFVERYMADLLKLIRTIEESDHLNGAVRAEVARVKREIDFDFLVEDSRKLVSAIRAGAQRAATIISDLKDFCRESKQDLRETDLVAGIETTLNLINVLLKDRITVERHYPPQVPRVLTNPGRINQVFMNILTNAAQAIHGEGVIRIRIELPPQHVEVSIEDTGVGIPPEIQSKILEPFFTTKEEGQGTGLGLWIADQIVRNAGGSMRCASQPGQGTTFTVTLPLRPPSAQPGGGGDA